MNVLLHASVIALHEKQPPESSERKAWWAPEPIWTFRNRDWLWYTYESNYDSSHIKLATQNVCRSQWPHGLRRRFADARFLRLWVRFPTRACMFVCCECCVLSGRGLCDGLITRLEESYRLWCVVVCDLETSWMRRPWPNEGCRAKTNEQKSIMSIRTKLIHITKVEALQNIWTEE